MLRASLSSSRTVSLLSAACNDCTPNSTTAAPHTITRRRTSACSLTSSNSCPVRTSRTATLFFLFWSTYLDSRAKYCIYFDRGNSGDSIGPLSQSQISSSRHLKLLIRSRGCFTSTSLKQVTALSQRSEKLSTDSPRTKAYFHHISWPPRLHPRLQKIRYEYQCISNEIERYNYANVNFSL